MGNVVNTLAIVIWLLGLAALLVAQLMAKRKAIQSQKSALDRGSGPTCTS